MLIFTFTRKAVDIYSQDNGIFHDIIQDIWKIPNMLDQYKKYKQGENLRQHTKGQRPKRTELIELGSDRHKIV